MPRYNLLLLLVFPLLLLLMVMSLLQRQSAVQASTSAIQSQPDQRLSAHAFQPNPNELLVFEVNRAVTTADRGFPRDDPPQPAANGDWTTPVNFAEGVMHYRVHVRNQPQPQAMRIQFCVWQDRFALETCGPQANVSGTADTVVTWSIPITEMWKLRDNPIDWTRPRQRYGIAIKNSAGKPVSDFSGWNWNGEDPSAWYPLDMRFTVVVVAKGESFSGWHNYIEGLPISTSTPTSTPSSTLTATPIATEPTSTPSPTATVTSVPTDTPTDQPTPTATVIETSLPTATATPTMLVPTAIGTAPTTTPTLIVTPRVPATGTPTEQPSDLYQLFLPITLR